MVTHDLTCLALGPIEANCYLVVERASGAAVCIDPGAEVERVLNEITRRKLRLACIALTHGHADHIGAVCALREAHRVPVAIHADDAPMLESAAHNLSIFLNASFTVESAEHRLQHGDTIPFGSSALEVIHTPGHTPGCVCFFLRDAGAGVPWLFSGDTLFQLEVGRCDLPGGDWPTLQRSISERLYCLPDATVVYPGHGPATTIIREKMENPHVRSAAHMA